MTSEATVLLVDDDAAVRVALTDLLRSFGYKVEAFATAQELLVHEIPDAQNCLVLDVNLPDLNGLRLQETLARRHTTTPIVFITGYGDIPMTVRAMKAGAVEFLTKPVLDEDLLEAIERGLERSRVLRQDEAELRAVRDRYATLTPRQREIMVRVTSGMLNKEVAGELGTSEVTIKVQRRQVMLKMSAETLPDLVRMADRLGLRNPEAPDASKMEGRPVGT